MEKFKCRKCGKTGETKNISCDTCVSPKKQCATPNEFIESILPTDFNTIETLVTAISPDAPFDGFGGGDFGGGGAGSSFESSSSSFDSSSSSDSGSSSSFD